jgi:hypothetical protein
MTLGGYADLRIRDRRSFAAFGCRDQPSPAMVRRMAAPIQDAMEARLGVPVPLTLGLGRTALGRGLPIAQ